MKGIVFTLDAIFALIVAIASISIMLYFFYTPQSSYSFKYSEASSVMSKLLSTNMSYLAESSNLASQILYQSEAFASTWSQAYNNPAGNAGSSYGPGSPMLSFVFAAPSNIQTGIVADYGNIYFASGTSIYAVNAATGIKSWSKNTESTVSTTPALYDNMLIYANATNLNAVNAANGSMVWSANTVALSGSQITLTSPILIYNGKAIFGASNYYVYAFYANNGTLSWSNYTGSSVTSFAELYGAIAFRTTSNNIGVIVPANNAAKTMFTETIAAQVSNVAAINNTFYYGSGSNANSTYINGIKRFGTSAGSVVQGVDVYNNIVIYQGLKTMIATNPSGSELWGISSSFGPAVSGAVPVIGGGLVYNVWSGNLTAQNLSSGNLEWSYSLPPTYTFSPNLSLAYGKLFAISGNKVLAFGTCYVPMQQSISNSSVLNVAASLYINNETGCAEALANSVSPISNYSITVSGPGAPPTGYIKGATYVGNNNYIYIGNYQGIETNAYSWSFWIYPYSWNTNNGIIGQQNFSAGYPYVYQSSNLSTPYRIVFSKNMSLAGYTVGAAVGLNSWYHIVVTSNYVTGIMSIYVNGKLMQQSKKESPPISRSKSPFYIGYLPMGSLSFNGLISDVQIYNTTLSPSQAAQLYLQGIDSPPLSNANLLAWYPSGCANNLYSLNYSGYIGNSCTSLIRNGPLPVTFSNAHEISRVNTPMPLFNSILNKTYIYNVSVYSWG
jgi:outer membrane protein assembly factor BamB